MLAKKLNVMDATAIALCRENAIPICVFNVFENGAMLRAVCRTECGLTGNGEEYDHECDGSNKIKNVSTVDHFKTELKNLRTNRANPGVLDGVFVEVYGAQMRIKELANVTSLLNHGSC